MSEEGRALVQARVVSRALTVPTVEAPLVRSVERGDSMFPRWPMEVGPFERGLLGPAGIGLAILATTSVAWIAGASALSVAAWVMFEGAVLWSVLAPPRRRRNWWKEARRQAVPLVASLDGVREGQLARVTGTVATESLFGSAVSGRRAVLGRYIARRGVHFCQAVDFTILLDGGDALAVDVTGAHCVLLSPIGQYTSSRTPELGAGKKWWAPTVGEALLMPGDRVEAVGVVQLRVDPEGVSGGKRAAPLRARLVAGRGPVLVRSLTLDLGSG